MNDPYPFVGAVLTALAVLYAARQFRQAATMSKHEFMLRLFERMDTHNELHAKLTASEPPHGDWPATRLEWIEVGRLLGLFEHIGRLVEDDVISMRQVKHSFAYRLDAVMANDNVRQFVYADPAGWECLIKLHKRLGNISKHE